MSYFIVIRITEKIGPTPILSVIYTVTIHTTLNLNGSKNGHRIKTSHVNRPSYQEIEFSLPFLDWLLDFFSFLGLLIRNLDFFPFHSIGAFQLLGEYFQNSQLWSFKS